MMIPHTWRGFGRPGGEIANVRAGAYKIVLVVQNKTLIQRAGRLELELFSMLCSREIFKDQSYHACIRSEKNPSIRSDACMTADYARGQPASAWPLAGQPCKVECELHTIARAHNKTFFVRLIGTIRILSRYMSYQIRFGSGVAVRGRRRPDHHPLRPDRDTMGEVRNRNRDGNIFAN